MHLHRITGDVEADLTMERMSVPLRHLAVAVAPGDEAIVIALMAAALAAAEARDVLEHLGMPGRELVRGPHHVHRALGALDARRKQREVVCQEPQVGPVCRRGSRGQR